MVCLYSMYKQKQHVSHLFTIQINFKNTLTSPCVLVTIVPQLTLYSSSELQFLLSPPSRAKHAAFLPILFGVSLTTSLAGMGLSGGALAHSLWAIEGINTWLESALSFTASSPTSLQKQVTSLAQMTLQNHQALDLFTVENGGTCVFLQEECCYYINESGLVEQNIVKLCNLAADLQRSPPIPHSPCGSSLPF